MVDPWRVAQLAVDGLPGRDGSRGSGYLIASGRVLTAAHVVAGASAVRVRLDVGQDAEVDVQAEGWWTDPAGHEGTDLAVVMIPEAATAGRECAPARFGRISDRMATLDVTVLGFPRFKLRAGPGGADQHWVFRDLEQAGGRAPTAANRRQGTLAVYLEDQGPSQPPKGESSPWEGMSGGPVWAAGRIVGIVAEHHPSEGTARLTARRIDRAYEELPPSDLGVLTELLGLPPTASGLRDVVPEERDQAVRSAYLAQVRDIAPRPLVGREKELADWAEFCAGDSSYAWWQAGPWAGKSALAAWFVTHPPPGADVVSFFITGRLSGQADSGAFLDAMAEQLNSLYPGEAGLPAAAGARFGGWLNLLDSAAAHAEERARRLVVVVDGLDEDDAGATPPRGRPSIASLLPRQPPPGVRFIVTSRPDPGLPNDLPGGHPLRACSPRRLPVSPEAEDIAAHARQELQDLLSGDQIAIDVAGYIAGSGGGLTRGDLSALAGAAPHRLDRVLRGVYGRSLSTRASTDPRDPAARVYLFAHETLRITAEEQLGAELARYREKVHSWIGSCASEGWPDSTPGYAIGGYQGLLAATTDLTRLFALARDPRRHTFLRRVTGSDYVALTEIGTAQSLIADQQILDLKALAELAAHRHVISIRNKSVPVGLPVVWARLGRFDHAEALARTITDPSGQARTLTELATSIAGAGDPSRAEALARTITDPSGQARALTELATSIAGAGDPSRAEALARTITDLSGQARALTELTTIAAGVGDTIRASRLAADAEALARTITDPSRQARAFTELAAAMAGAGDPDQAEALARTIDPRFGQAQALTELAAAIAGAGDSDRAEALARTTGTFEQAALTGVATAIAGAGDPDRAEALARTIDPRFGQDRALTAVVSAIVRAGDHDRAEALARTISAVALTEVAIVIAQAGDHDRAEAVARTISDPSGQARALTELATVAGDAADTGRASRLAADAEALARTISHPSGRAVALTKVAILIAQAGDHDRAEALARTTGWSFDQAALTEVVLAIAQAGDPDRAEALARTITNPDDRVQALADLATAAADAGDTGRASRLAADTEALARTITGYRAKTQALAELATAAAHAGQTSRAEALARTIGDFYDHDPAALTELATAIAQAGDPDRAEALAHTITGYRAKIRALTGLATAAGAAGDTGRASRLAADAEAATRTIGDPIAKAQALTGLATAAGAAGDTGRASRLAADAEAATRTIGDPIAKAQALTGLITAAGAAGDTGRASRLAADAEAATRTIGDPIAKAQALTGLITAAGAAGDTGRASRLAADAEALARTITVYSGPLPIELARKSSLASGLAADSGAIPLLVSSFDQAQAFTGLATAIAQAGDPDRAEALARTITRPTGQAQALTRLVTAITGTGDIGRASRLAADAEALARTITNPSDQVRALADLAMAAAGGGDTDRASRLAADAEALARTITNPSDQVRALADLAMAAAGGGDTDRASRLAADAEALARTITNPSDQARQLTGLAKVVARRKLPSSFGPAHRPVTQALTRLATALSQAGDPDGAETVARAITDASGRARALADLAAAAAGAGDIGRAGRLLAQILVTELSEIWWIGTVSQLFPPAIGDAYDVLASAYTTPP